jgi:hypothetical protein
MPRAGQFRRILPLSQVVSAGVFGGWGLWQRHQILSHDYLFGIGWNSTARFHVWPWPFKFAVIQNLPAFLAGALIPCPISSANPNLSETVQLAPSLLLVLVLWYGIGAWLDRWSSVGKGPWVLLGVFTAVCLVGAFIPIGHVGYLPYGVLVWLVAAAVSLQIAKSSPHRTSLT